MFNLIIQASELIKHCVCNIGTHITALSIMSYKESAHGAEKQSHNLSKSFKD